MGSGSSTASHPSPKSHPNQHSAKKAFEKHDLDKEKPLKNRNGEIIKWVPLTKEEIKRRKKLKKVVKKKSSDSDSDSDSSSDSDSTSSSSSDDDRRSRGSRKKSVALGHHKTYPSSLRRRSEDSLDQVLHDYSRVSRRSLRNDSAFVGNHHASAKSNLSRRNSFNGKQLPVSSSRHNSHSGRSSNTSDYHSGHGSKKHSRYKPIGKYAAPLPTLHPKAKFHKEEQVALLHKAVQGLGTQEELIINVLGELTSEQRSDVRRAYHAKYRRDLKDIFRDELSGDFEDICVALITEDLTFDVQTIHLFLEKKSRHTALIGLMATTSGGALKHVKKEYGSVFKEDLVKKIHKETAGAYNDVLSGIFSEHRESGKKIDHEEAQKDTEEFLEALHHDDRKEFRSQLIDIVKHRSWHQVREVCEAFRQLKDEELPKAVIAFLGAHDAVAFNAFIDSCDDSASFFAGCLHDFMKGSGTDEIGLTRLIISRSEIDLQDIADAYKQMYKVPLSKAIKDETDDLFQKMLLKLINPREKIH